MQLCESKVKELQKLRKTQEPAQPGNHALNLFSKALVVGNVRSKCSQCFILGAHVFGSGTEVTSLWFVCDFVRYSDFVQPGKHKAVILFIKCACNQMRLSPSICLVYLCTSATVAGRCNRASAGQGCGVVVTLFCNRQVFLWCHGVRTVVRPTRTPEVAF